MNSDTVYQTILLQFLHNWHSMLSERSYISRKILCTFPFVYNVTQTEIKKPVESETKRYKL